MGRYAAAVRTPAAAAGAAYATLRCSATRDARVFEIGVATSAATLSSVGLGRPANTPVATTSTLGQAEDTSLGAGLTNADTAWSTAPTAPTVFMRRFAIPATAGLGFIWTFQNGLVLPVSGQIVLWNFGAGAGSALDVYFVWDE